MTTPDHIGALGKELYYLVGDHIGGMPHTWESLSADQQKGWRERAEQILNVTHHPAHARGLAEGRRQATEGARQLTRRWWWPDLADARQDFERLVGPWEPAIERRERFGRPFFFTEPANGVQLAVTDQGSDGLAFVAQPHRAATEPYEQYGVVLPPSVVRELALRMLAHVGPRGPEQATPSCTCPMIDVTHAGEAPGSKTVKGYSATCPVCPNPYAKAEQDGADR